MAADNLLCYIIDPYSAGNYYSPTYCRTLFLALSQDLRHPKIGRITIAMWLYVSVTGVVIFLMLSPYANPHVEQLQSKTSIEVTQYGR